MSEIFGILTALFAIISGCYAFYNKIIKPKINKTKLLKLSDMIEKWFDIIDCNLEKDLNTAELNNIEKKIHAYIDNNLSKYLIKLNKNIIRKWNKKMGIKKELQNSLDIFQKFSRIQSSGMFLDMFFTMIIANFYKFHSVYNSKNKQNCNFADVEIPVKFFKFYVENI